jgi:hypothetical protein
MSLCLHTKLGRLFPPPAQHEPRGVVRSPQEGLRQGLGQVFKPSGVRRFLTNMPVFIYVMQSLLISQRVRGSQYLISEGEYGGVVLGRICYALGEPFAA